MTITIRQIQYFIAVSKHGSFSRASEALYVSQPALSQQILMLEEALSVKLIDRSSRHVKLTDSGEVYLKYVTEAMKILSEGERSIVDLPSLNTGVVKVAAVPPLIYPVSNIIRKFNEQYPGIFFSLIEKYQDKIFVLLHDEKIDIGFGFNNISMPFIHNFNVDKLVVGGQKICFFASKEWIGHEMSREWVAIAEQYPIVLLNRDFALRRLIDSFFILNDKKITPIIETNSISAILTIVKSGKFASYLPEKIVHMDNSFYSEVTLPLPRCEVVMFRNRSAYKSKASQQFAETAIEICSMDNF